MSTLLENTVCCSPCLVVAGLDGNAARAFRRSGWDVYSARTGPEARRLARMMEADLIVLDTLLPEESGWLTCEKLTRELPGARVVLVDADPDAHREELAEFVGAGALIARDELATLSESDPAEAMSAAR
jgi:CheY-like chemotaxis protein